MEGHGTCREAQDAHDARDRTLHSCHHGELPYMAEENTASSLVWSIRREVRTRHYASLEVPPVINCLYGILRGMVSHTTLSLQ